MAMRKGTCKAVRGKRGVQVCRLQNGKVRFRRKPGGTRGVSGVSGGRGKGTAGLARGGRKCIRFGRSSKTGARVCRKYSTGASRKRNR